MKVSKSSHYYSPAGAGQSSPVIPFRNTLPVPSAATEIVPRIRSVDEALVNHGGQSTYTNDASLNSTLKCGDFLAARSFNPSFILTYLVNSVVYIILLSRSPSMRSSLDRTPGAVTRGTRNVSHLRRLPESRGRYVDMSP